MTYKKISKNIIPISNSDFAKSSLPRESFLHLDDFFSYKGSKERVKKR